MFKPVCVYNVSIVNKPYKSIIFNVNTIWRCQNAYIWMEAIWRYGYI